jgi:four helix bundle protein
MRDFKSLMVWTKAHQLTLQVYRTTAAFPKDEQYGLTSQTRRAAASIPANIAEGCGRSSNPELARFMQIALGSASELEYHVLLAHDLNLIRGDEYQSLTLQVVEIKRMLSAFIQKLNAYARQP